MTDPKTAALAECPECGMDRRWLVSRHKRDCTLAWSFGDERLTPTADPAHDDPDWPHVPDYGDIAARFGARAAEALTPTADPAPGLREALYTAFDYRTMIDVAGAMPWYDEADPDYTEARNYIVDKAMMVATATLTTDPAPGPGDIQSGEGGTT